MVQMSIVWIVGPGYQSSSDKGKKVKRMGGSQGRTVVRQLDFTYEVTDFKDETPSISTVGLLNSWETFGKPIFYIELLMSVHSVDLQLPWNFQPEVR